MNRLARWITRLYPSRWRLRYGEEVVALIEDAGADVGAVVDLLAGALRMQFSTWSLPRLAAVLGMVGMLAGVGATLRLPTPYVARAELVLTGAESPVETMLMLRTRVTSRVSLSDVIIDPRILLYQDELRTTPLQDVIEEMKNDVVIDLDGPNRISIRFTYRDEYKAKAAVGSITRNAIQILRDEAAPGEGKGPLRLDMVDNASLPVRPLRMNPVLGAGVGLGVGIVAALLWFAWRRSGRRAAVRWCVAGALAGAAVAWFAPSLGWVAAEGNPNGAWPLRYESHAALYAEGAAVPLQGVLTEATSRESLSAVVSVPGVKLYASELKNRELEDVLRKMRQDLVIATRSAGTGRWIDVSFTYYDRFKCQQAVQLVMDRIVEVFNARTRAIDPGSVHNLRWGVVRLADTGVQVESVLRGFRPGVMWGLGIGLALAVLIAAVRVRWKPREDAPPEQTWRLNWGGFGKRALWLGVAGATAGAILMAVSPVQFTSDALVSFGNVPPQRAGALINEATDRMRADISHRLAWNQLEWRQVESGDPNGSTFRFSFTSGNSDHAQEVLRDVIGAIDRRVAELRGTGEGVYEQVRGVDGALVWMNNAPVTLAAPGPDLYMEEPGRDSSGVPIGALTANAAAGGSIFAPKIAPESAAVPTESRAMNGFSFPPTQSPPSVDIPLDDERARPQLEPAYRTVQMRVIDPPGLAAPSGDGWLDVAAGAGAGLLLALVVTMWRGFRGGKVAKLAGISVLLE